MAYNSSYTGAQIDAAVGKAGTAIQPASGTMTGTLFFQSGTDNKHKVALGMNSVTHNLVVQTNAASDGVIPAVAFGTDVIIGSDASSKRVIKPGADNSIIVDCTLNPNILKLTKAYDSADGGGYTSMIANDVDGFYVQTDGGVYFDSKDEVYFKNDVHAPSFDQTSDERLKDIIDTECGITVDSIADAPLVHYTLKGTNKKRLGSIALYWKEICPESVNERKDGYFAMNYAEIALANTITLARKVREQEEEIKALREEIEKLKK